MFFFCMSYKSFLHIKFQGFKLERITILVLKKAYSVFKADLINPQIKKFTFLEASAYASDQLKFQNFLKKF